MTTPLLSLYRRLLASLATPREGKKSRVHIAPSPGTSPDEAAAKRSRKQKRRSATWWKKFAARKEEAYAVPLSPNSLRRLEDKRNSCGTIHLKSTLHRPDVEQCCEAAIEWIYNRIRLEPEESDLDDDSQVLQFEVFEDRVGRMLTTDDVSLETVAEFYSGVFYQSRMLVECIATSLALLDRILRRQPSLRLTSANWRPLVYTTLRLASKWCEDDTPKNREWPKLVPDFPAARLLALDRAFLDALAFDVAVTASVYADFYFQLRTIAARRRPDHSIQPLQVEAAKRIHAASRKWAIETAEACSYVTQHRASSLGSHTPPVTKNRASIEHLVDMSPSNSSSRRKIVSVGNEQQEPAGSHAEVNHPAILNPDEFRKSMGQISFKRPNNIRKQSQNKTMTRCQTARPSSFNSRQHSVSPTRSPTHRGDYEEEGKSPLVCPLVRLGAASDLEDFRSPLSIGGGSPGGHSPNYNLSHSPHYN